MANVPIIRCGSQVEESCLPLVVHLGIAVHLLNIVTEMALRKALGGFRDGRTEDSRNL